MNATTQKAGASANRQRLYHRARTLLRLISQSGKKRQSHLIEYYCVRQKLS